MKLYFTSLILLATTLICAQGQTNVGVTQNGGSTNQNWTWFNAPASWGSGANQIGPGSIITLISNFSGSTGTNVATNYFNIQGSGTVSSSITIRFASNATLTAACWSVSGAININGQSNIVIDGGVNGLIQNTNNGSNLGTQQQSFGIIGTGDNVTIKNLIVTNIFISIAGQDNRFGGCIAVSGNSLQVTNCNLSWADACLNIPGSTVLNTTWSNVEVWHNHFYHFNHAIFAAPPQTNGLLTNTDYSYNYFNAGFDFNLPNSDIHNDGIIIGNNDYNPNLVMANTTVHDNFFTSNFPQNTTSGFYIGCNNFYQQIQGIYVWNNVVQLTNCNNPLQINASNAFVFNNTCYTPISIGGQGTITGSRLYNNISSTGIGMMSACTLTNSFSSGDPTNQLRVLTNFLTNCFSDYNVFASITANSLGFSLQCYNVTNGATVISDSLSGSPGNNSSGMDAWQTWVGNEWGDCNPPYNTPRFWLCGNNLPTIVNGLAAFCLVHCDPHSITNIPTFIANSLVLATNDTVAQGHGTNLYNTLLAMNSKVAALSLTDYNGNSRPLAGNWDIGAYQATTNNNPAPPVASTNIINVTISPTANQTWIVTTNLNVSITVTISTNH